MANQQPQGTAGLKIPADTQSKFAALIELIKGSESMNDEERQYWINILPIMTGEQLKNLEEILVNEKEQLAAIDQKYAEKVREATKSGASVEETGKKIRASKQKRVTAETAAEQREKEEEASILEQIRNL